jgi:hypothetical protein
VGNAFDLAQKPHERRPHEGRRSDQPATSTRNYCKFRIGYLVPSRSAISQQRNCSTIHLPGDGVRFVLRFQRPCTTRCARNADREERRPKSSMRSSACNRSGSFEMDPTPAYDHYPPVGQIVCSKWNRRRGVAGPRLARWEAGQRRVAPWSSRNATGVTQLNAYSQPNDADAIIEI